MNNSFNTKLIPFNVFHVLRQSTNLLFSANMRKEKRRKKRKKKRKRKKRKRKRKRKKKNQEQKVRDGKIN